MNKKTSLSDVGETLDKLVAGSKSNMWKHYDFVEDYDKKPAAAEKEYKNLDYDWSQKLLWAEDPKTPLFIDDPK